MFVCSNKNCCRKNITMRIQGLFYLCVLAFHMCRCDDVESIDSRENTAKRPQWGPTTRSQSANDATSQVTNFDQSVSEACHGDIMCLAQAAQDRAGLEAIAQLHRQLDDDANGNVDLSESDDFLREELQYDSGYERRQRAFHHNDDMHISVRELWEAWLRSEVHNWTTEQTVEWLSQSVDLPQYTTVFVQHRVTGATLPRLAVNNMQYMSSVLGIKDPIHKQKLALKAMDVVLFGPPKEGSRWKDWLLALLLAGALGGGWAAVRAGRASRSQLRRMERDMDQLRHAELALDDLQKELERARLEQENVTTEKQNLERRLREAGDGPMLTSASSDLELSQLRAEIEMLRSELRRAEGELEDRCWAPPHGLQQWLQLTHEVENRSYLRKKTAADLQLQQAREACEKLRKKRTSLVGAFVSTHGKSIDDVDRSIVEARTALNEVTQELQERVHRWKQIEMLCGFNIINNNGLQYLESALYRQSNGRPGRGRMSSSQDDLSVGVAEDAGSVCGAVLGPEGLLWREDSSGSEDLEPPHYPQDLRVAEARRQFEERLAQEARDTKRSEERRSNREESLTKKSALDEGKVAQKEPVHFVLGGDNVNWTGEDLPESRMTSGVLSHSQPQLRSRPAAPLPPPRRPHSSPNAGPIAVPMVRSRSTDVVTNPEDQKIPSRNTFIKQRTLAEETNSFSELSTGSPADGESTDSSVLEEEGSKPRRRKLHFPFTKNKSKGMQA